MVELEDKKHQEKCKERDSINDVETFNDLKHLFPAMNNIDTFGITSEMRRKGELRRIHSRASSTTHKF